jgi:hypothetical protein
MDIQFSQHHFLKTLPFLPHVFGTFVKKSDGCGCVALFLDHLFCSIDLHICFHASTTPFLLLWLQIKWTQIGKEEVKLLLFVDDKPIFKDPKDCIENPYSW